MNKIYRVKASYNDGQPITIYNFAESIERSLAEVRSKGFCSNMKYINVLCEVERLDRALVRRTEVLSPSEADDFDKCTEIRLNSGDIEFFTLSIPEFSQCQVKREGRPREWNIHFPAEENQISYTLPHLTHASFFRNLCLANLDPLKTSIRSPKVLGIYSLYKCCQNRKDKEGLRAAIKLLGKMTVSERDQEFDLDKSWEVFVKFPDAKPTEYDLMEAAKTVYANFRYVNLKQNPKRFRDMTNYLMYTTRSWLFYREDCLLANQRGES